jgi:hypothetical protein
MSKIEAALVKATGVKRKAKESHQDFGNRLVLAFDKLPEEAWDKLEKPAQEWLNAVSTAKKASKEIPDFPDAEAPAPAAKSEKPEAKAEKPTAAAKEKKPAAEKKPAKAAEPKEKKPKELKPGVQTRIKQLLVKKPTMGTLELQEALNEEFPDKKPTTSTIQTIAADFKHSVRVLTKAGKLDEALAEKFADA